MTYLTTNTKITSLAISRQILTHNFRLWIKLAKPGNITIYTRSFPTDQCNECSGIYLNTVDLFNLANIKFPVAKLLCRTELHIILWKHYGVLRNMVFLDWKERKNQLSWQTKIRHFLLSPICSKWRNSQMCYAYTLDVSTPSTWISAFFSISITVVFSWHTSLLKMWKFVKGVKESTVKKLK